MKRTEVTAENVDELIEQYEGVWKDVGWISDHFHINTLQLGEWSRGGFVRRRPIPKDRRVHRGPRTEYLVADAISERLKRNRNRPFRRKMIDGRFHALCPKCDVWRDLEDGFYHFTRDGKRLPLSTCKKCHCRITSENSAKERKARAERERALRDAARDAARAASEYSPPEVIPAKMVVDALKSKNLGESDQNISERAGLHYDTVRKIKYAARSGKGVKVSTVDRLFTALDMCVEMSQIIADIDVDAPRWHKKHSHCQVCMSVKHAHRNRGVCIRCYPHRHNPDYVPPPDNRWSLASPYCISCKQSERRHVAFGLCSKCYYHKHTRQRRAVGYGHGNLQQTQRQQSTQ